MPATRCKICCRKRLLNLTYDDQGNSKEQLISAAELEVGDRILVKPGQLIPADATIASGFSSIDESALTGEYMPQRRCVGETVIGGTLNVENPIQLTVTHVGSQTQLSAIVRLLERAASEKPKVAKLADKVANYFVACVLLAAIVVSISWYFIDPDKAFWITLSVLVVTCPCALSLATPTALTTATGNLRQRGLLITRGHVLENLALCTDIVFDKTGTLTQGNLCIEKNHRLGYRIGPADRSRPGSQFRAPNSPGLQVLPATQCRQHRRHFGSGDRGTLSGPAVSHRQAYICRATTEP